MYIFLKVLLNTKILLIFQILYILNTKTFLC